MAVIKVIYYCNSRYNPAAFSKLMTTNEAIELTTLLIKFNKHLEQNHKFKSKEVTSVAADVVVEFRLDELLKLHKQQYGQ